MVKRYYSSFTFWCVWCLPCYFQGNLDISPPLVISLVYHNGCLDSSILGIIAYDSIDIIPVHVTKLYGNRPSFCSSTVE